MQQTNRRLPKIILSLLFLLIVGALGYSVFIIQNKEQKIIQLTAEHQATLLTLEETATELELASSTVDSLLAELGLTRDSLTETASVLEREKNRNAEFEEQISTIASTVGVLDKLSKTDKELLQKYSKVYFLNEHYIPESLSEIDPEWKYSESRSHQLHSRVLPYFEQMLKAAKADGVDLWVISAYRSYSTQAQLKAAYTVTYGSGANAFSADQGFSEHQLGTAVDFTTRGLGGGLDGFENTDAFEWLEANAHLYGFTLSYPRGNAYYIFEPWHWRFVGVELARDLKRANAHFYDWEQRKIDAYLVSIFD